MDTNLLEIGAVWLLIECLTQRDTLAAILSSLLSELRQPESASIDCDNTNRRH
jgi:hypothetical protein